MEPYELRKSKHSFIRSEGLAVTVHVHDVGSLLLTSFEKGNAMSVEKTIGSNSLVEVVDRILDKGIVKSFRL